MIRSISLACVAVASLSCTQVYAVDQPLNITTVSAPLTVQLTKNDEIRLLKSKLNKLEKVRGYLGLWEWVYKTPHETHPSPVKFDSDGTPMEGDNQFWKAYNFFPETLFDYGTGGYPWTNDNFAATFNNQQYRGIKIVHTNPVDGFKPVEQTQGYTTLRTSIIITIDYSLIGLPNHVWSKSFSNIPVFKRAANDQPNPESLVGVIVPKNKTAYYGYYRYWHRIFDGLDLEIEGVKAQLASNSG